MEKTVDTLASGETLLVSAKGVKGGKVQLEFAEQISNPNAQTSNSIVADLNRSDDRFDTRKARRAWVSGEKSDIQDLIGVDVSAMSKGDEKLLNILNPELGGQKLKIQVTETTEGDEYQKAHPEATAKRSGADGPFIKCGGKYIFSNTTVVKGEAVHTFLKPDAAEAPVAQSAPASELSKLSA